MISCGADVTLFATASVNTTLLFDLDDTLVAEQAPVDAAFRATCEISRDKYGADPDKLYEAIRRHSGRMWHASETIGYAKAIGISSWEGLWGRFTGDDPNLKALHQWVPRYQREAWAAALAEAGVTDTSVAPEAAECFIEQRRVRHEVFPETRRVLRQFRGSFRMGIITNGAPDIQRQKIAETRMAPYFDMILVSGEFGQGKPDPRIFHFAMHSLGGSVERSVMVGNSLSRDIAGARAAGIKSVWVLRDGTNPPTHTGIHADETIASLDQLGPALERLGLAATS